MAKGKNARNAYDLFARVRLQQHGLSLERVFGGHAHSLTCRYLLGLYRQTNRRVHGLFPQLQRVETLLQHVKDCC